MPSSPALIVAHPGHELMVFGWVEETRPRVSILTDGSGRGGVSRVPSSLRVLQQAKATLGTLAGAITDVAFYDAMLDGDIDFFLDLTIRMSDELLESHPPYVAGDAREGFNPIHDTCRTMIDAAVTRANRAGAQIGNYEFVLFAPHDRDPQGIVRKLNADQFERKVAAARDYPELASELEAAFTGTSARIFAQHRDLASIVDASIEGISERSFAIECLVPVGTRSVSSERPFYETYGEKLVAAGTYQRAIRYREHVLPIETALARV
jgi:hypothetical protein